jgi:hypothetical protein
MKNKFFLHIISWFIGFALLNLIVLMVSVLQYLNKPSLALIMAIVLGIGSFSLIIYFSPLQAFKKASFFGLFIAIIGGYITGSFFYSYKHTEERLAQAKMVVAPDTKQYQSISQKTFLQIPHTKVIDSMSCFKKVHFGGNKYNNVCIMPLVDSGWKAGDSIYIWASIREMRGLFAKKKYHFMQQIASAKYVVVPVESSLYYNNMLEEAINRFKVPRIKSPLVVELINPEMELAYLHDKSFKGLLVINLLWLLAYVIYAFRKNKP